MLLSTLPHMITRLSPFIVWSHGMMHAPEYPYELLSMHEFSRFGSAQSLPTHPDNYGFRVSGLRCLIHA